ncbi:DUF5691 domain-containing protein [Actinophytocola xanthii]|uniref:Uncharacterized protein n=1 Tax=Actinophytocola xanthii TaxID=1912961 RepID=A0A1Q8CA94_9PSEU|nr:DUF5691 domain-containing protein [Actinophytocola xanthii]OLF11269.1 hypothetical protein BU204_30815 [Actinophytocola xanthii]
MSTPAPDSWESLLGAAVVGTGRRAVPEGVLARLAEVDADSPEATVLAAAAVLGAYRRAGWTPPPWHGTPDPPAEPDPRPLCSATAAQLLELLLDRGIQVDGGNELLVAHWSRACARAGTRPPAPLVLALLRLATTASGLREDVRTVTGPRGAWLARRNPRWSWAAPVDLGDPAEVDDRFATGTWAERLAVLAAVRRADPAAGRRLVERTWADEQAAARAGLVDALATGLSEADEPFLESALDDRAATVRAAAAALLDRLPGSRRAARMAERVRDLTPPEELDAAARRDGVTDQREHGQGRSVSWLIQMLGAAPLGEVPADLAAARPELVLGWTRAALRQRNERWLAALAEVRPTPELLGALPPERATAVVAREPTVDARFAGLLAACPGPWSPEFSREIVGRLRTARTEGTLTLAFQALARHLHHTALPQVEEWLEATPVDRRARRRTLRGLANALTIRRTIEQEFPS